LQRLAKCDPQPDELIVVEQSAELDPRLEEALKLFGNRGILVRQEKPNAQVARNRAAQLARSEVLLFLDDDVDPDKNLIGAHVENYQDPTIHAVAGFYLEPGETEVDEQRKVIWWRPLTQLERVPASYSKRVDSPLWPSCNGSIRREVCLKLGGFDENYRHTLLDDTDLAVRMLRAGYRCVHDPKARLFHRKEPTGGNRPAKPGDLVIASREKWYTWFYFFWMNYGLAGLGEILLRMRTNVFRRSYLMNPKLLLIAVAEMGAGLAMAVGVMFKGRKLMGKG
jgi:GT2 family glycosyltransferase